MEALTGDDTGLVEAQAIVTSELSVRRVQGGNDRGVPRGAGAKVGVDRGGDRVGEVSVDPSGGGRERLGRGGKEAAGDIRSR